MNMRWSFAWSIVAAFPLFVTPVTALAAQADGASAPAQPSGPPNGAASTTPAAGTGGTGAASATAVPVGSSPAGATNAGDDDGSMTIRASRNMDMQQFAESSQQELTVAGARTRYALNLFGDIQLGASSRSEGLRRPNPAFAVGVFDMLFTANLEKNFSMTSEFSATYEPNSPLAELERLHLRWKPSKHFFIEAGRFHTDLGYWNVAYHHGRYLQLTVERPRMILLHGGLLPVHWIGAQAGVSVDVGKGAITLIGSVGTARERAGSGSHGLHGSAFTGINAVHGKLEFSGFLHRDLKFGVSGVYDRIPDEAAFVRPGLPNQSIDEKIANAFIALPSVPFIFISEAYGIEHTLNSSALPENVGSKWRTLGAFALLGYQIGRFTPYLRGEIIKSEVGAYIFDPFYVPEPNGTSGFSVTLDSKEAVVGTRIDVSDWCAVKAEYQLMTGVGTRRADLPTPAIHTGTVSWSFGI